MELILHVVMSYSYLTPPDPAASALFLNNFYGQLTHLEFSNLNHSASSSILVGDSPFGAEENKQTEKKFQVKRGNSPRCQLHCIVLIWNQNCRSIIINASSNDGD